MYANTKSLFANIIFLLQNLKIIKEPTFITSFDVDDYVLFFLKEKSLEQIAESQDLNYARVVRVCKNDIGTANLGNQWSSMRKTRLTCVYNNTYLNELEDVIRVNDDLFVGLFSLKLLVNESFYLKLV